MHPESQNFVPVRTCLTLSPVGFLFESDKRHVWFSGICWEMICVFMVVSCLCYVVGTRIWCSVVTHFSIYQVGFRGQRRTFTYLSINNKLFIFMTTHHYFHSVISSCIVTNQNLARTRIVLTGVSDEGFNDSHWVKRKKGKSCPFDGEEVVLILSSWNKRFDPSTGCRQWKSWSVKTVQDMEVSPIKV